MRCVVCGKEVAASNAKYANAWEASLKQHPCCSQACCGKFDPDLHWIPAMQPTLLSDAESSEVMERGKRRIKQGDAPKLVARDLLLAGLAPWMVRRALVSSAAAAVSSDKMTGGWNAFAILTTILFGHGDFVGDRNRGLADVSEVLDGSSEVDAWEDHFGASRSSS